MVRSSKLLSRAVVTAAALAFPLSLVPALSWAQDAATPPAATPTPAAASPATSAIDPNLKRSADDFWHYVGVARYELAGAEVKKLAESNADPIAILRAFESVASDRKQDLDRNIARWNTIEALKEPAVQLTDLLNKGRLGLRADQAFVEDNVKRLVINERAYQLAVERLRQSGELAVPLMVDYLRNPAQVQYHGSIRRALTDMGKFSLSPLLAATEMKDARTLTIITTILGDMGYEPAVPYLLKLSTSPDVAPSVRAAAAGSLAKLGASRSAAPADAFTALGEKFYYEKSLITANLSQAPVSYIWFWDESRGLTKKDVPPQIFNELQAMRAAEYALTADRGKAEALSLWLAANYKREVELPSGATDTTRAEGQPNAHYYGVAAGARYLNDVLNRALKDGNSPVALKAVKSLQNIVGQSSIFMDGAGTPLSSALSYPDRAVRFEAAFALAAAMPQSQFGASDQVVPVLAEAVAQTGKPGVIVVGPSNEAVGKWVEDLQGQGYNAVGVTSAEAVVAESNKLPSIDVIVVSEDAGYATIDRVLAAGASAPRLGRAPKVIVTKTNASPYVQRAAVDPLVNATTQPSDPAGLKTVLEAARNRGGSNPLDEAAATDASLRALWLLKDLAIAHNPLFDVVGARPTLIAALDDARPEVAKAAGQVLSLAGQREGQLSLLNKATSEKLADDLRISLLKSLSTSAKMLGNQLPMDSIAPLEKLVESAENLDVRGAAAEARGALNLPPEEAKSLIIKQAKH